ncbi:MAG: hypothetical protein ILP19_05720 [Oscillospiraceae bacterium]|nr:hypothetical protein [Oscillospiraceae bacterium]
MKNKTKRTLCLLTALAVTASSAVFTACKASDGQTPNGGNSGSSKSGIQTMSAEEVKKSLAFKTMPVKTPEGMMPEGNVVFKNGLYYAVTSAYKALPSEEGENKFDNYEMTTSMMIFDEEGNLKNEITLFRLLSEGSSYGSAGEFSVDDSGNIVISLNVSKYDPNSGEGSTESFIKTFDAQGNEIASIPTNNFLDGSDGDGYLSSWVADGDGNIYLLASNKVIVLDKTGSKLFDIQGPSTDNAWLGNIVLTNSGKAAYTLSEYSNTDYNSTITLNEIDVPSKGVGKTYNISGATDSSYIYSGSGDYLFYARGDTGILGIKPDMTVDSVLNLLTLGIDSSSLNSMYVANDGSFLVSCYGYENENSSGLTRIYPVDASEVKEKTLINLGCFYTDWSIRSLIADFNKENENYTIIVNSYSDNNDTSNYEAAMTAFNNELLVGNVPDLLLINDAMPYESYAAKGLFTDLYTLIDSDPELTRDDFLKNVLESLETKDQLFAIAPAFSVSTFAVKESHLGGKQNLTLTDAKTQLAGMQDGIMIEYGMTREDFVNKAISFSDFIDYDNAKCDFDNDAFKAIIEYSKEFPESVDYESLYNENPDYWEKHQRDFLDDKSLIYSVYMNDIRSMDYTREQLGSGYTFTNFPTDRPVSTGLITTESRLSISNTSSQKDGAWTFIKYCLDNTVQENHKGYYNSEDKYVTTDDVEYTTRTGNMPVLKKQYDLLISHALDPKFYYDYTGKKIEDENFYYSGSEKVKLPPMSQQELDLFDNMFKTPTKRDYVNEELSTIIKDELSSYYAGNKSVDETVQLIQSRANIYMSEHY